MPVRSPIYSAKSARQPIGYIESDKVFDVFDRLCANYNSASGLVRSRNDDALLGYISFSNVFVGPRRIMQELFAKATAEVVPRMQRDEKVSDDEIFVAGTLEHANVAPASAIGAEGQPRQEENFELTGALPGRCAEDNFTLNDNGSDRGDGVSKADAGHADLVNSVAEFGGEIALTSRDETERGPSILNRIPEQNSNAAPSFRALHDARGGKPADASGATSSREVALILSVEPHTDSLSVGKEGEADSDREERAGDVLAAGNVFSLLDAKTAQAALWGEDRPVLPAEAADLAPADGAPGGRSADAPPPTDLVVHLGEWSEFEQAASIEQPVDRRDSAASTPGAMWAIPYRQEGGDDGASEEDRAVVEKFAANDETGRNAVADSAEKFHPEGSNERRTTTHESRLEESLPEANWRVDCLSAAVETTAKPALYIRGADHGTRVGSDDGDGMDQKRKGGGRELAAVEAFMQCIAEYAGAGEDQAVAELDAHGHDSAVGPSATVPSERFTGDQKGLTCDGAAAAELPDGQSEPSAEHAPHAESYAANGPAAILMVKNEPADVIEVAAVAKAEHVETIRPQPLPDRVEGPSGNVPVPGDHNALENTLPDWPRDDIGHSEGESLVPAENAFGGSVEGMPNPAFNDQVQPGRIGIIEHDDPVEQDIAPVGNDDAPSCAFEQAANLDVRQTELSSFDGQKVCGGPAAQAAQGAITDQDEIRAPEAPAGGTGNPSAGDHSVESDRTFPNTQEKPRYKVLAAVNASIGNNTAKKPDDTYRLLQAVLRELDKEMHGAAPARPA